MSHDEEAFAAFFEANWDMCTRAVLATTGDLSLAEEQVAEAFARAWSSWPKLRNHPALPAWVVRTRPQCRRLAMAQAAEGAAVGRSARSY